MRKVQIITIPLLIALFVLGACAPTIPPTPAPTSPIPPTPTSAPTLPTPPTPTQYPWESIFIWEVMGAPVKGAPVEGDFLEVNIDLGRQFSSSEIGSLRDTVRDEVKLIDENGQEYRPVRGAAGAVSIIVTQPEFVSWQADFAYGFQFKVDSRSCSYTLYWPDYPPLEIGNPFKSPFLLESRAPTPTPIPVPTPTPLPTPTPSKPHFTSDDGRIEFALDNVDRTKVWPAELRDGRIPKEGHDFVLVDVIIIRIADGHVDIRKGSTLIDNNGAEYNPVDWQWKLVKFYDPTNVNSETELVEGSKGTLLFELPENVEPVKVRLAYLFFKSWSKSGQHESEEERYIDIILP